MTYDFTIFECLVSLGIMAFVWFYLFDRLRRDNFRSDIRRIRDGLFDFMWKNGYDFNTTAYRETRQMLNGIIVISKVLKPIPFLIATAFVLAHNPMTQDKERCNSPDSRLNDELRKVRHAAMDQMLRFVFLGGMFGVFVRVLLLALTAANYAFRVERWAAEKGEDLMELAYVMGRPPLSPVTKM